VAAIVISDASPLIGLAQVNGIDWLRELFGTVLLPATVADEVLTGRFTDQEARITAAVEAGWLAITPDPQQGPELPDLDEGEAASIRLALSRPGPVLLLIDERAGTAAVIGLARLRGLIPSAREVFDALHNSDFRIAPAVITTVLKRCGEIDDDSAG
jgi:predicted nucleic acid-binding protein